ncbi:hypothetical protein B0293_04635 [Amycolatopsis azurea DSM 43854]|uniref:Cytochrome P450 n=2 Tax=Amycolatopsis azurea TaxID=36819 RepID=A0ABX3JK59_9PSEU|nr:hypothetical protein B0293_04635 [Amycolatopsis azurea DSM 43854]
MPITEGSIKAQDHTHAWSRITEEVLRYHNNGPTNLPRIATSQVQLSRQKIEVGDPVLTSSLAAAWDSRAYHRPSSFDPKRRRRDSIWFGIGRHRCLGAQFAHRAVQAAISSFFCALAERSIETLDTLPQSVTRIKRESETNKVGFLFHPKSVMVRIT